MAAEHICTLWGFPPVYQKPEAAPSPVQSDKFSAPNLMCHGQDKLLHHQTQHRVQVLPRASQEMWDNQCSLNPQHFHHPSKSIKPNTFSCSSYFWRTILKQRVPGWKTDFALGTTAILYCHWNVTFLGFFLNGPWAVTKWPIQHRRKCKQWKLCRGKYS